MWRSIRRTIALLVFLLAAACPGADFFPMSVWYGGGKARAPMLERDPDSEKEVWRQDLKRIHGLGFNAIRCWIDWATGQPAEDRYNFATLDVLLGLAEQEGLKVILQVYMDSAPNWVSRKFPDSLFVSSNGEAIRPESSPGYCLDHLGVREADLAFYRALAERARRSSAFLGWDLWSEPHVVNWANPTYIDRPEFCFCTYTKRRFRDWLRRKYGSLDALNEAWYRSYTSWDEVEPNRLSTILSYTDYIDWKTFIQDKLAEDLRARYEAVKSVAPDHVATSHAAGVGLFSSPHWWEGQPDDWKMAGQVDYYGTSFYPKHSAFVDRDALWRAALLDFARSFGYGGGRPGFWIGELQAGFGTIALNVSPEVTPDDLRVWTWSALARGAKGIHYYAWYPMSSGYESGGFGMIHLDGRLTERSRVAGEIARVVDRNQDLFLKARPPRAEVAVIYNPLAHFVGGRQRQTAYGGPQGEVAGIERDSLLGVHRAMFGLNVPLDFVHIDELSQPLLRQYRLVIFPYPVMFPERAAAVLREYVRGGGALVVEARLGWNNEKGRAAETIPGMGLAEVMGCREKSVRTGREGSISLRWTSEELAGLEPGAVLPGRWYQEVLEPSGPQARVAAVYDDGAPAAALFSYGSGKTLMLGSFVAAAHQSSPSEAVERLYSALLRWAGVELPAVATGGPVEVRFLESGHERVLFAFNHGREKVEPAISLLAQGRYRGADLVTNKPVELESDGRHVRLGRVLNPGEVWVVRLTPQ